MSYRLGKTSLRRLEGVHPLLIGVVVRAMQLTSVDFTVFEGRRTRVRQAWLYARGRSKTMNSRHLTGHAVDLPSWHGKPVWDNTDGQQIANAVKQAARECGVTLEWGGDWKWRDVVHFQLPKRVYG